MLEWLFRKHQCISMKFRFWAYRVCIRSSRMLDLYSSLLCLRRLVFYICICISVYIVLAQFPSPCSPSRVRYISFFLSDLFLQFSRVEKHRIPCDVLKDKPPNLVVMAATVMTYIYIYISYNIITPLEVIYLCYLRHYSSNSSLSPPFSFSSACHTNCFILASKGRRFDGGMYNCTS